MTNSLQHQIAVLRATKRILALVAHARLEQDKGVSFLAELSQGLGQIRKSLEYIAPYRDQVVGKIESIKEAKEDARVQAVLEAFPDAEVTDVKEIEAT